MGKNPLFNQMGGAGNGNMMQSFSAFMNQNRGRDPDAMIREIVQSGRLSQGQLDQIQQRANQISGLFDGLKSSFGF